MSIRQNIANELKILRESNRYPQKYIASVLNITREGYANYENGKRAVSIETLMQLVKLYGLSYDRFFAYAENMDTEQLLQDDRPVYGTDEGTGVTTLLTPEELSVLMDYRKADPLHKNMARELLKASPAENNTK